MTFTPTEEQVAVVDFLKADKRSLLVNALAGAAKTSTLVMAAHAMPMQPTLCLAFNKKIADEMAKRMPSYIKCATLNSIGHGVWGSAIGKRLNLDTGKNYDALQDVMSRLRPEDRQSLGDAFGSILTAIRAAKSSGYIPEKYSSIGKALIDQGTFHESATASLDVEPDELFWAIVDEVLCIGIAEGFAGKIDFDDQLYLSNCFGGSFPKYPVVMVDEAQDLSPLNHSMLEKMVGGRLIAVGDPRQAIYAFRGAHTSSMSIMKRRFSMEELTLSISFRCSKEVVKIAQKRAPHMKSPEWAIEGKVDSLSEWDAATPPDGSFVICRNNAPLFKAAMRFIRAGRGVKIAGSDVGTSLLKLLAKMGKPDDSQEVVIAAIEAWREKELLKASKSREGPINDRADCMLVFAENGKDLREALAFAKHLFEASGPVQFMTGHKAKGLETDNVYYLDSFLIPSKWSRKASDAGDDSALEQEKNLNYVIVSRSKNSLFYVNSEDLK